MVAPWQNPKTIHLVQSQVSEDEIDVDQIPDQWRSRWQAALGQVSGDELQARLKWDKINSIQLISWLQSSDRCIEDDISHSMSWQSCLGVIQATLMAHWQEPLLQVNGENTSPFIDLWTPLAIWAEHEISTFRADRILASLISRTAEKDLIDNLIYRLCDLAAPVLMQMFAKDSSHSGTGGGCKDQQLDERLDGKDIPPRIRYQAFIEAQRQEGLKELVVGYPVLAFFLGITLASWRDTTYELMSRLVKDHSRISRVFGIPSDGVLQHIELDLGDAHCDGRSVAILVYAFARRDDVKSLRRVVYKPRDIKTTTIFQSALVDLNNHSSLPPFRIIRAEPLDGYGYCEYVEHCPALDNDQTERFYINAGRMAAVLTILGCTDCHHENLVASGDQLIPIDLETLLEPLRLDIVRQFPKTSLAEGSVLTRLSHSFADSVLRTHLLPYEEESFASDGQSDTSALGISSEAGHFVAALGYLDVNTDSMRIGHINVPSRQPTSLPVDVGIPNPILRFLPQFCHGFKIQSQVLMKAKARWLRQEGLFDSFKGLSRRIVLRRTREYMKVRHMQIQPHALSSWFNQAMVLEGLVTRFLDKSNAPTEWATVCEEMKQMQALDIPYFSHNIDSDIISIGDGLVVIRGFILKDGLQAARERLQNLGTKSIGLQLYLIRTCFSSRIARERLQIPRPRE